MNQHCEACEIEAGTIVEPCDDAQYPYLLCSACHQRLHAHSLRPREWYNLAKRHDWQRYLLHDDFYDEDGAAIQPDEVVKHADDFPVPNFADVAHDFEALLDYSITRWQMQPELISAWKDKDPQDVLSTISGRFAATMNVEIRSKLMRICSLVGHSGCEFTRRVWDECPASVSLTALAEASSACLPRTEGFERVTAAIARIENREKLYAVYCLDYFPSPNTLDWIEHNVFEPITETWGNVAAACQIDWPRIETWFSRGRPLSLIAIDALQAIMRPMTPFLQDLKPTLASPPSLSRLREVLLDYRERDRVPRVQKRIDALLDNAGDPPIGPTSAGS